MNSSEVSAILKGAELREGEEINDLQLDGLVIIQKKDAFRFGTDAVLLADFAKLKKKALVADFGTGTGAIALLIAGHHPDVTVKAIEIQTDMADMAGRSVVINALEDRVQVYNADIRNAAETIGRNTFDAVVCNPPYFETASSVLTQNENKLISRTDTQIGIDEICKSAAQVLKSGGRLSVVYPARMLNKLMRAMETNALAPKRIRTVHATAAHAPKLVLIDAVKHGGEQLEWLPPLIIKNDDGSYSEEWHRIYG